MSNVSLTSEEAASYEIQFSILRQGASQPGGPYSEEQILEMLREKHISKRDYVFYEGMRDWQPIEDVFEIHEKFNHMLEDGQDRFQLSEAYSEVSNVLTPNEDIYYIAIQDRPGLLSRSRQCVIISDFHLYHLTEKRAGYELEAHRWEDISNTLMREEKNDMGTFSFLMRDGGRRVDVSHLPIIQVKRLFQLAQEMKA